jgi:uncharacterized RDD family membrane protein YckC
MQQKMNRASVSARFVALLIDIVIVTFFSGMIFVAALAGYRAGSGQLTFLSLSGIILLCPLFSLLVFLFYFTFLTMEQGMTIGKSALGIRVVVRHDFADEEAGPGFFRSLVRTAAYFLSASICFLGFFMAFFLKGITLHDIIAGTSVVVAHEEGGS